MTNNTSTSLAAEIAALCGDDGLQWRTIREGTIDFQPVPVGTPLPELLDAWSAECERQGDKTRWTFSDGSIITTAGDAWDFGFPSCYCWEGAGHNDDCAR